MELGKLAQVITKVISRKRVTGLGLEIEGHFKGKILEKEFRDTEKQATKNIVLGMANALKEILTDVGSYDRTLDECIDDIAAANDLLGILVIKDKIINAANKSKSKIQAFKRDFENSQNTVLSLSKKLEQTQSKAVVDSTTKVFNRSAYDMRIIQAIHEFKRYGNDVCLIVCDIDHFKKFNDNHGHRAGDKVLASTATTMKNAIRTSDQLFQYGGEEFVVLLYCTPVENALKVADKIRADVKRDFFLYKGKELKVTISVGVAFLQEGDTETSIFERADKAMYEAKRNGRDRVEISPESVPA